MAIIGSDDRYLQAPIELRGQDTNCINSISPPLGRFWAALAENLPGMTFLSRLASYEARGDRVILTARQETGKAQFAAARCAA